MQESAVKMGIGILSAVRYIPHRGVGWPRIPRPPGVSVCKKCYSHMYAGLGLHSGLEEGGAPRPRRSRRLTDLEACY